MLLLSLFALLTCQALSSALASKSCRQPSAIQSKSNAYFGYKSAKPGSSYAVVNRFDTTKRYAVGDRIRMKCQPGFEVFAGAGVINCLQSGKWSRPFGNCRKARHTLSSGKSCRNLPRAPANSKYLSGPSQQNEKRAGSAITFVCNPGFKVENELFPGETARQVAQCMPDGSWRPLLQDCRPVSDLRRQNCPEAEQIKNGVSIVNYLGQTNTKQGVPVGSTIVYRCHKGYNMKQGASFVACEATGKWTGRPPICVPDQPNSRSRSFLLKRVQSDQPSNNYFSVVNRQYKSPSLECESDRYRNFIANTQATNSYGETSIHIAVLENLPRWAECILLQEPYRLDERAQFGRSPLHYAADVGHTQMAITLIRYGADIEARDTDSGATPLSLAAAFNNVEVAELLLRNGANVNALINAGLSPLQLATAKKSYDVIPVLIRYGGGDKRRRLHSSTQRNRKPSSPYYQQRYQPNIRPQTSPSAPQETAANSQLIHAAELLDVDRAKSALDYAANPLVRRQGDGSTPLHIAASKGSVPVARVIVRSVLEARNKNGDTPLHSAVLGRKRDSVIYLVRTGQSADVRGLQNRTPLHYAASRGYLDMVDVLLRNGANISLRDSNGSTALHLAAMRGFADVAAYLVKMGSPKWLVDNNGDTPENVAGKYGNTDLARYLASLNTV